MSTIVLCKGLVKTSPSYIPFSSTYNCLTLSFCRSGTNKILCCVESASRRTIILKGQYLYRYSLLNRLSSGTLKGIPVDINEVECSRDDADPSKLILETLEKRYVLKCESLEDADDWVKQIRAIKKRTIKERMGHSEVSESDKKTNAAAETLIQSKKRTKAYMRSTVPEEINSIGK